MKIKQKYKNLFWQSWGIIISVGLIIRNSLPWKILGIVSIVILLLGILSTLLIPESSQPVIKKY